MATKSSGNPSDTQSQTSEHGSAIRAQQSGKTSDIRAQQSGKTSDIRPQKSTKASDTKSQQSGKAMDNQVSHQNTENKSDTKSEKGLETRSISRKSEKNIKSNEDIASTRSSNITRKRAYAEKAKIELEFARKQVEIELRKKEMLSRRKEIEAHDMIRVAKMEAEVEILEHEKRVAMAETEVLILESSEYSSQPPLLIPIEDPIIRTNRYVESLHDHPHYHKEKDTVVPDRNNNQATNVEHTQQAQLNVNATPFQPQDHSAFTTYLLRRDLLLTRLSSFSDRPEDYTLWKKSFISVIEELKGTDQDQIDLLMKWLGPESKLQATNIRKANLDDLEKCVREIWKRLDDRFGAPEQIEEIIRNKVLNFPTLTPKDTKQLYLLADLTSEIEAMMASDTYGQSFSYFNSSGGMKQIIQKLPYNLQERWSNLAFRHKEEHYGLYPPFNLLTKFIRDISKQRNDPSLQYRESAMNTLAHSRPSLNNIRTRMTEVQTPRYPSDQPPIVDSYNKHDTPSRCPMHGTRHNLNECYGFKALNYEERIKFLKSVGYCYKCCLGKHLSTECTETVRCSECNSTRHPAALHIDGYSGPAADRGVYGGERISNRMESSVQASREIMQGKGRGKAQSTHPKKIYSGITSKCTQICKNSFNGKSCGKNILALVYPKGEKEKAIQTYICLDDQSNSSLCDPSFCDEFGVDETSYPYILSSCNGTQETFGRRASGFVIEALDSSACYELPTLIECQIPGNIDEIPTPEVARCYPHLRDMADMVPPIKMNSQIQILIGRDLPELHHVQAQLTGPRGSPYAQRLPLGWVIVGEACLGKVHPPQTVNVNKLFTLPNGRNTLFEPCENNLEIKETGMKNIKDKEDSIFMITPNDNESGQSEEDRNFLQLMNSDLKQNSHGYWEAPLPFKDQRPILPNNRTQAVKRAESLHYSLKKKEEKRKHFMEFMDKLLKNNHAEVAPPLKEQEEHWYLPIFGVYHPQKPNQIRAVFDSSANFQGTSLNSVLMQGPDLTNSLLGILLKFRKDKVGVMADIESMFHCFVVKEEHRNYLRFLWYDQNDITRRLIDYRMRVHCFGNKPSPAVATYGLRKAAEKGEKEYGTESRQFVNNNFYVDDAVGSFANPDQAISVVKRTQASLKDNGNIRLHKIVSNYPELMKSFPTDDLGKNLKNLNLDEDTLPLQRTLGMIWDTQLDTFKFSFEKDPKPCTRRGVLSTVNSIYDPLGLLAPVLINGKLILREITSLGIPWDDKLPEELCNQWNTWKDSLTALDNFHIPRMYIPEMTNPFEDAERELHIFTDASQKVISAAAYLKVDNKFGFIMGKAKVAPTNGHTIPRLELCAAVLGINISLQVCKHLSLPIKKTTYHSDSKIVLGYISNNTRRFTVYVTNRVEHIRKYSHPGQWKYVSTTNNPADQATRPTSAAKFSESAWLLGPDEVAVAIDQPTAETMQVQEQDRHISSKKPIRDTGLGSQRFEKFSSWNRLVRGISTLKQFATSRLKERKASSPHKHVSAENLIYQEVQREMYSKEIQSLESGSTIHKDSSIASLNPVLDNEGLLRVGGRLRNADLKDIEKHPLIIPCKHHIALLLVRHHHELSQHQGRHFTEGALRSAGLWIVGCRRLINSVLHKCIRCRKARGKTSIQKMADLPEDRLTPSPPFSYVGVDTFGPWEILSRRTRGGIANSKRWALLFTCLVTRAIHIEVIEELSSSSFVNAVRRFIALRGSVIQFRSDRGTNFVGATDILNADVINVEEQPIKELLNTNKIRWVFNPPHSPHMGGVWERMIGIVKRILQNMMQNISPKKFTHEVLSTFLAEVCGIVNGRPICAVSSDPEEPTILSPSTLLTMKVNKRQPLLDCDHDIHGLYLKQWRQVQALANTFWARFKREYLPTLQKRSKWVDDIPNIKEGDLVLIRDNSQCKDWTTGRVSKAIPSGDGKVRKVTVNVVREGTVTTYTRPVTDLVLLMSTE